MVALIVIAAILLLVLFLLLCPVRLEISFEQEFFLRVRYLFLSFPIPLEETVEEEAETAEEETEEKPETGESALERLKRIFKQEGFSGFMKALKDIAKLVGGSVSRLLSHLKLKSFDLYLCVGGADDAAEAAIFYGQVSAAVYSACGILFSKLPCKKKGVTVDLDYSSPQHRAVFAGKLSLRPLFALKEAVILLKGGLPFIRKFR